MSNKKLVKQYGYSADGDGGMSLHKDIHGGLVRTKDVKRLLEKVAAHINSAPNAGTALQEELARWTRVVRYKT